MATKKEIQSEINGILWKACDTFRGAVDPSEYKNYILVMLFVKYVSDVWQDHYDKVKAEYGDDEERILRRLKRERFVLPPTCTFASLYGQRNAANLGEVINEALDAVEEANKEKLEGVFRNIDFNSESSLGQTRERNGRLKKLLEDFNDPRLDLRPSRVGDLDVIGDAYEYLIGQFAAGAGKKAGEFYTPPAVSQLIARLVEPKPGERISDPACGSGSLLIKCGQQVGSRDFSLYGQEANGSTWALAKMNMFLHGMDNARIEWGDTIRGPKLLADDKLMKFEVVVANPPFSLDKWGQEEASADTYGRFHRGVPPKGKGDYAFITHMIETITEDSGRVGVVVPHGVLFRGASEGRIRQKLVEANFLDAIIGLPANLFYGTNIPAAILVFRKHKTDKTIVLIDASQEYEDATNQNRLRAEDIDKIIATYKARKNVAKYAHVANFEEIKENEFNLNIPRYVDTFEEDAQIDVRHVQDEIQGIEAELVHVRELLGQKLPCLSAEAKLRYVALGELVEKIATPIDVDEAALYREIGIRSHGKGIFHKEPVLGSVLGDKRVYKVEPGCLTLNIVFAWEQAIAVTTTEEVGFIASHRFPMFRPDLSRVEPKYILSYFLSPKGTESLELASPGGAGRNRTLSQSAFLKMKIPLPSIDFQRRFVSLIDTLDLELSLHTQNLDALRRRRKGLMQQLLSGKDREKSTESSEE